MDILGLKIKKIRELKNINQKYIAEQLGISQSVYSDIENGKINVTESRLQQISKILDVTPEIIKSFSDSVWFNNCTQSGYNNIYHLNPHAVEELIHTLSEELKTLRKERELFIGILEKYLKDIK